MWKRLLATRPTPTMPRITNRMQAGDHDDPGVIDAGVQTVWEARQQEAARFTVDNGMCGRETENGVHRRIHGINELVAETRSLELIPVARFRHVGDCRCKEPGVAHADQPRSRRLASSHEMTAASPLSSS